MKRSRKIVSILLTLALLATLLVPMATPAFAGSSYTSSSAPFVTPGQDAALGNVKIYIPTSELGTMADAAAGKNTLYISLPTDYKFFPNAVAAATVVANNADAVNTIALEGAGGVNYVEVNAPTASNALSGAAAGISGWSLAYVSPNQISLTFAGTNAPGVAVGAGADSYVYIKLLNVFVPSGKTGDIKLSFEAPGNSMFTSGQAIVGMLGSGSVSLAVDNVPTMTYPGAPIGALMVKEDRPGALSTGANSVKLKLPPGFTWDAPAAPTVTIARQWGTVATVPAIGNLSRIDDNRTLVIANPNGVNSTEATYFKINGLAISVDDSVAKSGDVVATITGNSTSTVSSLTVAKYGDAGVTVSAFGDPKTVKAGATDQEIGAIALDESAAGSLRNGYYITLQLTGGAVWYPGAATPIVANAAPASAPVIDASNSHDYNAFATGWSYANSIGDTIRVRVGGVTTNAAKWVLNKATINVSAGASGDIKVIVGGTAGATGEIKVATVAKPVTVTADTPTSVVAGLDGQAISDIVVTETVAEGIASGNFSAAGSAGTVNLLTGTITGATTSPSGGLYLEFPVGIFPSLPKMEVIEGDVQISQDSIARGVTPDGRWCIGASVKSTSSVPSKVKFSGITVKVDRGVAEGNITVGVKGALNAAAGYFPGYTAVAGGVVAKVVTPASTDIKTGASFVIDSNKYKVGGVEKTMDVAPYVKDGRTFLPVRYVAEALGVSNDNIIWNEADQTVTLLKGDKVVQVKIGSNSMLVNGVSVSMDVAAEITSGRTMLPFRFIAQALGATVTWDEATKTVTLK